MTHLSKFKAFADDKDLTEKLKYCQKRRIMPVTIIFTFVHKLFKMLFPCSCLKSGLCGRVSHLPNNPEFYYLFEDGF